MIRNFETGNAGEKYFINICKIYEHFATSEYKALDGFHAITGKGTT